MTTLQEEEVKKSHSSKYETYLSVFMSEIVANFRQIS